MDREVMRKFSFVGSSVVVIACTSATPRSAPTDAAPATDARAGTDSHSDVANSSAGEEDDPTATPLPCDESPVVALFSAKISPLLENCNMCHDSAGGTWMGKPGPPWFYAGDAGSTVRALVRLGLVAKPAETSTFLWVLIPIAQGGISHSGGKRFDKGSAGWLAFTAFVTAASACAL
jgi:hypothetical protein